MTRVLLIAQACDGTDVGEAWVSFQWARLMAESHEVTVISQRGHDRPPLATQLPGARVVEWSAPRILSRAERFNSLAKPDYISFHRRTRRWIQDALAAGEHFDVAHQPVPVAMRYPSPVIGTGIPLVLGPVGGGLSDPPGFARGQDTAPWYTKLRSIDGWRLRHDPLLRRTYEGAALVLGIAPYVEEALTDLNLRRFEVMSETAISTLPQPVDRQDRTGPLRLLFVGRLIRTKGTRDVIRALSLIGALDVHLDVVGEGPDREACEALAAELRVAERVTFHGWLARPDVDPLYRAADVFAFPSYREPGGNVVFEAMSYGLPLIVVNRGGPGAASDDTCAVRLNATTPEALARDIATAVVRLADAETRATMGRAARERVQAVGMWPQKKARMEQLYEEVSSSDPMGPSR